MKTHLKIEDGKLVCSHEGVCIDCSANACNSCHVWIEKPLKTALCAAVLSAGQYADKFNNAGTVYPAFLPAGIKSLKRQGRADLIPALKKMIDTGQYDVTSMYRAKLTVESLYL